SNSSVNRNELFGRFNLIAASLTHHVHDHRKQTSVVKRRSGMSVQTILKMKGSKVVSVEAGAMAREAAQVMQHHNIGALVMISGGRTAGVLTQRDLAYGLARHGPQLFTMQVKDLVQPGFISV